jgi:hypothetical protein
MSIADLLAELKDTAEYPTFQDDRGFQYVLVKMTERKWEVRKLADDSATTYFLTRIKNRWYCSCPAGRVNRRCKHSIWITRASEGDVTAR